MANETNRTKDTDESRVTPLMKSIGSQAWAAISLPFLRFLQADYMPRPIRVLFYLVEHSWATMIPPEGYRGDGKGIEERRKFRPSLAAVKEPHRSERSGFWVLQPIREKDIADDLGIDKGNVSNALKWLQGKGVLTIENKRFVVSPIPIGDASKKLSESTTFWSQHPLFQQLENLRLKIEAELEEAKRAALEPVIAAYRPKLEEVKTQERKLKKELRKAGPETTADTPTGKVVDSDNFSESTPTPSTRKASKQSQQPRTEKVVDSDNFLELSPIPQVVDSDNFEPRIKRVFRTKTKNNNNRGANPQQARPEDGFVVVVLNEITEHFGSTTEPAVRKMVDRCRKEHPGCTPDDVIRTMRIIARGFNRQTSNPVGVLLTQTPIHKSLKASTPKPKPAAAETGPACSKCRDTGLVNYSGPDWKHPREVHAAIEAGAEPCECQSGDVVRQYAEIPA